MKDKTIRIVTPSIMLPDGTIGEMIYDGKETKYARFRNGTWECVDTVLNGTHQVFVPYSPRNNLIRNRVVLFPDGVSKYASEEELLKNIQQFIHRYVDVSPLFERLSTFYVLFSWVYDDFSELPYLRVLGDAGSGKTRFLLTVGSLCYKPIFASGASTVSPLFRLLDIFHGTLLIDEGDFPKSDEKAEIVKILNNGNAKGFPVLRSEPSNGKEYNPRAYHVFGPKIIATRSMFTDRALESRCLTEEMGHRPLRKDIPINLPSSFWQESVELRNQLLYFRFRHLGKNVVVNEHVDRSIAPRLNQVFVPLLSIIEDKNAIAELKQVAREYHRQYLSDKGMSIEAHLLEIIAEQLQKNDDLSMKAIAHHFAQKYRTEYEHKITPKWIGSLIRRKLHLRTERRSDGYAIAPSEHPKIQELLSQYGLKLDAESEK